MTEPAEVPNKPIPDWAATPFHQFLDHQDELARILRMSMDGIAMLRGRHEAIKFLAEIDDKLEEKRESLERAAKEKDLAQKEIDNGFPILHEQATVAIWSSLEALVRDFCAKWIANKPDAFSAKAIKDLRVKIGEYEALEPADRCLWIVDKLDQEVGGPLRAGVGRFESLLENFGLSGTVEEQVKKALFELSEVRHVLVHRRGVADKRLTAACPWLKLQIGEKVKITQPMWLGYYNSVGHYVLEIVQRIPQRLA